MENLVFGGLEDAAVPPPSPPCRGLSGGDCSTQGGKDPTEASKPMRGGKSRFMRNNLGTRERMGFPWNGRAVGRTYTDDSGRRGWQPASVSRELFRRPRATLRFHLTVRQISPTRRSPDWAHQGMKLHAAGANPTATQHGPTGSRGQLLGGGGAVATADAARGLRGLFAGRNPRCRMMG